MDQEAEIMQQSMVRREAAQEAAEQDDDLEEEPQAPLRTISSVGRGTFVRLLSFLLALYLRSWVGTDIP